MRSKGLTYADAARLMGSGESALVRALDTALGGVLLVATAGASEFAISLFDAKSELTRLSEKLAVTLGERREGLGRLDRNERMAAAHSVVVLTAFFEAVRDADLPFRDEVIRLERREQAAVARGEHVSGHRLGDLASELHAASIPPLSPTMTITDTTHKLASYFAELGRRLYDYVSGLAIWDKMSESEQQVAEARLVREIPGEAVKRWLTLFRRLATDFPELSFYLDRADHEATREELRHVVAAGLAALTQRLADAAVDLVAEGTRAALVRRYWAELDRPIVDSGEVPAHVELPTLREGYLDPDYRVAAASSGDRLYMEEFWASLPVNDDLAAFLVAYLSSVGATERPLLILGQPGAGKSVLTKVVAGNLPVEDFLVVRVVLRQAPADADVQTQIEDAVRRATGEGVGWPALSRAVGTALRVIVLDGFDELLQATSVGKSRYLRDVAAFQERETDQGRPVAVVVTSRAAVADRALLPATGVVALHLEPFRDEQVARWLELWDRRNAEGLARRGLRSLPASAALEHRELAEQPLLLLMLALYDAEANDLQHSTEPLSTPDLYERLLELFARREVAKDGKTLGEAEIAAAVRDEVHRLSIAAIAMFHRGRQWVTQAELDFDMRALSTEPTPSRDDFHAPVTPAADAVGRFFFVHRIQSRRADEELTAVEFLHATFGEYLVARLVMNELTNLLAVSELDLGGPRAPLLNPDLLLDALAFTPLTVRDTVTETLAARLRELTPQRSDVLRRVLIRLFRAVTAGRAGTGGGYHPVPQSPAGRQALQSLNLLILVSMIGEVTARELFGIEADPSADWRSAALLWYGQCSDEGWRSVTRTLMVTRLGDRLSRDLRICVAPSWIPEVVDPLWSIEFHDFPDNFGGDPPFGWGHTSVLDTRRTGAFLNDQLTNDLLHAVDGFPQTQTSGLVAAFASTHDGEAASAVRALIDVLLASADGDNDRLIDAYDRCLGIARWAFAPDNWTDREQFLRLMLRQATADRARLPDTLLDRMAERYSELVRMGELPKDADARVRIWAQQVIPRLNE